MQWLKRHPVVFLVIGFVLVAALIFSLCGHHILTAVGNFLLKEETPVEADYIAVLQGSIPDRVVHGAELYNAGYADTLLMAQSRSFANYELIEKKGLELPEMVELNKKTAKQLGVPEEDIHIVPGEVDSTQEEALAMASFLKNDAEKEPVSMLLVTSGYHSYRADRIFTEVMEETFNDKIRVVSTPTPHDPFSPDAWWKHRPQARNVLMEYLKLLNYFTLNI